jgi:hypothetical protein
MAINPAEQTEMAWPQGAAEHFRHLTTAHQIDRTYAASWSDQEMIEWHAAHDHSSSAVDREVRHSHPGAWAIDVEKTGKVPLVGRDGKKPPTKRYSMSAAYPPPNDDALTNDLEKDVALVEAVAREAATTPPPGTLAKIDFRTRAGALQMGQNVLAYMVDYVPRADGSPQFEKNNFHRWMVLEGRFAGSLIAHSDVNRVQRMLVVDVRPSALGGQQMIPVLERLIQRIGYVTKTPAEEGTLVKLANELINALSAEEPLKIDEPLTPGTIVATFPADGIENYWTRIGGRHSDPDSKDWASPTGVLASWNQLHKPEVVTRVDERGNAYVEEDGRQIRLETRFGDPRVGS